MGKVCNFYFEIIKEEFEDTKGAIRNRISKKSRQHNGQKKIHIVAIFVIFPK
jgi:hypothetical protein